MDNHLVIFADTVFIPEANLELKLRSLKNFYLDSPDIKVHGPEVVSCSAAMLVGKMITDAPDSVEVTSESFEVSIDDLMYLHYIYFICICRRCKEHNNNNNEL